MKSALITGITGQDGSYLAEFLLAQGYRVLGLSRLAPDDVRRKLPDTVAQRIEISNVSIQDSAALRELVAACQPREIYNFAAFSSGRGMYDDAVAVGEVNGLAVARMLEVIREVDPGIRFCQASSSEIFAQATESPQSEGTPLCPRSPYGAAKCYADLMIRVYRQRYGLFACSAVLYNHESPRRGLGFVTRKIAHTVAQIRAGRASSLRLGNLSAVRDWGFAGDYVRAMYLMLQTETPQDFVICSGRARSVRDFCEVAFAHVGLDYRQFVVEDSDEFRVPESVALVGDNSRAQSQLGWRPTVGFEELVAMLVDAEVAAINDPSAKVPSDEIR